MADVNITFYLGDIVTPDLETNHVMTYSTTSSEPPVFPNPRDFGFAVDHHTFAGWSIDVYGQGGLFQPGEPLDIVSEDYFTNYVAVWERPIGIMALHAVGDYINDRLNGKQDVLVPGSGISIIRNEDDDCVISVSNGQGIISTNWKDGAYSEGSIRSVSSAVEVSAEEAEESGGELEEYTLGEGAVSEGNNSKASGDYSHSEGVDSEASGTYSHAEGFSEASGDYAHSEGGYEADLAKTYASGIASHAEGFSNASGDYSHSEGRDTSTNEEAAHAEGFGSSASGVASHAEGCVTSALGYASHSEGRYTVASRNYQHVFGEYNIIDGLDDGNRGTYVEIVGNGVDDENRSNARTLDWSGNEVLAGKLTLGADGVNDMDAVTVRQLNAGGGGSGLQNLKDGSATGSLRSSTSTQEDASYSLAIGSVALGYNTKSSELMAFSEGNNTVSSGLASHSEGAGTVSSGSASHSEGMGTTASGDYSHAEGQNTVASGEGSHAEGGPIEGGSTPATASGKYSHVEGAGTEASGDYSHAEGGGRSQASGKYSHAEGYATLASGQNSHVQGLRTVANTSELFVFGRDNRTLESPPQSSYLEIVGNGTGNDNYRKSNARNLSSYGDEWLANSIILGGGGVQNPRSNYGSVRLHHNVVTGSGASSSIDVRQGPGTDYPKIDTLNPTGEYEVSDRTITSSAVWINLDGIGWVAELGLSGGITRYFEWVDKEDVIIDSYTWNRLLDELPVRVDVDVISDPSSGYSTATTQIAMQAQALLASLESGKRIVLNNGQGEILGYEYNGTIYRFYVFQSLDHPKHSTASADMGCYYATSPLEEPVYTKYSVQQ